MINYKRLQKDAKKFFRQLKKLDLISTVTYVQKIGEGEYDVVKSNVVPESDDITISMYLSGYSRREIANDIRINDTRAIALVSEFTITPKIDDTVLFNEQKYIVINYINNPHEPTIEFQLRSA